MVSDTFNHASNTYQTYSGQFDSFAPRDGEADKVTFTAEQQARIDEIVREAMGRAGRDARTENDTLKTQLQTLQTDLAAAKDQLKNAVGSKNKEQASQEVADLEAKIAEMNQAGASVRAELERTRKVLEDKDAEIARQKKDVEDIRKGSAMRKAADKVGFVDVDMVVQFNSKAIKWDESEKAFIVVNESGQPRLNAEYKPMTLDEYFADFATKNPWTVRGDVKGGVGSTPSQRTGLSGNGKYAVEQIFGPKAVPGLANKLGLENKAEYRRLRQVAIEQGLLKI